MSTKAQYVLKDADEGQCQCSHDLKLLTDKNTPDGWPAFLICFGCKSVTQVDGDNGETVQYKGGRRRKFTKTTKDPKDPKRVPRRRRRRSSPGT